MCRRHVALTAVAAMAAALFVGLIAVLVLSRGRDHDEPDDSLTRVQQAGKLKKQDTALIDSTSRKFFGDPKPGTMAELSDHAIQLVGTFELGPDFRADGYIIVSDRTYFKCFPNPRAGGIESSRVEFGLVRVAPLIDRSGGRFADLLDAPLPAEAISTLRAAETIGRPLG